MTSSHQHLPADITARSRAITKPGQYALLPQADRVGSTLPNWEDTVAQVLTTPALGAKFVQMELIIAPGGGTREPVKDDFQHFLYVLDGDAVLLVDGKQHYLSQGGTVWLPPSMAYTVFNNTEGNTRILWLRCRYEALDGVAIPDPIVTNEKDVAAVAEDTYIEKHLIPYDDNLGFNMAFNLLIFEPGTHFGFVETHVMEHGLYMLDGRGFYYLNGDLIEVTKNDYIYMAPFCPQYFAATGWETGRYILYKDVNRDYVEDL